VCAENLGLTSSLGEIILLCDDDVILPTTWIVLHIAFYEDPTIGAVGGSANNHRPDGSLFPKRKVKPIGKLAWFGKCYGNMYDQIDEWVNLPPLEVNHLVGYNFSLRRSAIKYFELSLKPYWHLFELDACLQVRAKGYRVMFDFSNVVDHYPTNTAYVGGRNGNLEVKIFNGSYNNALILAKHSSTNILLIRFLYMFLIGSDKALGLLASIRAVFNYHKPLQELGVLQKAIASKLEGWRDGLALREIP
jgi:GT2 family glycosyltransferase